MQRLTFFINTVLCMLYAAMVSAADAEYELAADTARAWIEQQQNADGSWGTSEAIRPFVTAEAALSIHAIQGRNTAYYRGVTWLENHLAGNVDANVRRILVLAPHGDDVTSNAQYLADSQQLVAPGNNGWGVSAGYGGSPIDTALALLANAQLGITANVQLALDYLKSTQLTGVDQGWPLVEGGTIDPMTTAVVIQAFVAHLSLDPGLATNIGNAVSTLNNLVGVSDAALVRAHTALALLRDDIASIPARTLLDSLVTEQLLDGSWGGDLTTTEVTARAMAAALGRDAVALDALVSIPDANLRAAINLSLGRSLVDSVSLREMVQLTDLTAPSTGIGDLTGLESATNLTSLDLSNNQITDLSPLAGLTGLTQVVLVGNPLSDAVDTDGDGLGDLTEANNGTNPLNPDTDGDGIDDLADPFPLQAADGDLNLDGVVNAADVLIATRVVQGNLAPGSYLGHGDVAPLVGGVPSPNGVINAGDLLVIQRKALGMVNF